MSKEDYLKHINVNDRAERKIWAEKFKCKEADLIDAVMAVGGSARVVNDYLILNRRKTK